MRISISNDHAGFEYKISIKEHLQRLGHEVHDFGAMSPEPVDYPDYIRPGAEAVANGTCDLGIVLGGSGNGEAIVANKVRGIRCAVCWNAFTAEMAKRHNNANIISIGQRTVSLQEAIQIVEIWLQSPFDSGRHLIRINKIENYSEIAQQGDATDLAKLGR
jgi:ribose 5-phosphate isomerase B